MVDWTNELGPRPGSRGLAVEGDTDRIVIEAFLDAGQQKGRWSNWYAKLVVRAAGNCDRVIKDVDQYPDVWGLIDRDWRSDDEIAELPCDSRRLLILPRMEIENYLIDPDELMPLLPASRLAGNTERALRQHIEGALAQWIPHGALSWTLSENGIDEFCRRADGRLGEVFFDTSLTSEGKIRAVSQDFRPLLDPQTLFSAYQTKLRDFQNRSTGDQYICIDGKKFFNRVIVRQLNSAFGQEKSKTWLSQLVQQEPKPDDCPADLIPILQEVLLS